MKSDDDCVTAYMPLFYGDYKLDTGDLDCLEHGAYLQLLAELWTSGGYLPFDPHRLSKRINLPYAKWDSVWATISRFFDVLDVGDGLGSRLSQKRLLYEMEKAREMRRRRSDAGRKGGIAAHCVTSSNGQANVEQNSSKRQANVKQDIARANVEPSPSPSPDQTVGKREDSLSSSSEAASPPPLDSPSLLVFPTARGRKSGSQEWHYTERLEAELRGYFPALNVRSAVLEALAWVRANPGRRKTESGMAGFLTGWLTRAQNRGQHVTGGKNGHPAALPGAAYHRPAVIPSVDREKIAASWKGARAAADEGGRR